MSCMYSQLRGRVSVLTYTLRMSTSAVFILDLKGGVLLCRNYRGDIDLHVIERFMPLMMEKEEEGRTSPVVTWKGITFVSVLYNNIYLVSITKKNCNVTMVTRFLYKIVEVFSEYFGEVEEESIRDNFVIVYELLDEIMDFGYPQTTDSNMLKEYITQQGLKLQSEQPRPPANLTKAVSWRPEGIRYRKNEVFMDVIESINLLAAANGTVLRSEVVGSIKLSVYLSGMPELRLGLNDRFHLETTRPNTPKPVTAGKPRGTVELEDVRFHQCVRLSRFESERTIAFIPPDGDFELVSYRVSSHVKPLIWIESVIERYAHSRVEYMIKAVGQFKPRSTAHNVEIIIPVPSDADSPKYRTSTGSVKYVPEENSLIWEIRSFPGGKEYQMRAHFNLPSVQASESEAKLPIRVKFEIPYFTVSGLQVRYLKIIDRSGYQALPWVRYVTQNGDYVLRTR